VTRDSLFHFSSSIRTASSIRIIDFSQTTVSYCRCMYWLDPVSISIALDPIRYSTRCFSRLKASMLGFFPACDIIFSFSVRTDPLVNTLFLSLLRISLQYWTLQLYRYFACCLWRFNPRSRRPRRWWGFFFCFAMMLFFLLPATSSPSTNTTFPSSRRLVRLVIALASALIACSCRRWYSYSCGLLVLWLLVAVDIQEGFSFL